jgi:hypothetical protein
LPKTIDDSGGRSNNNRLQLSDNFTSFLLDDDSFIKLSQDDDMIILCESISKLNLIPGFVNPDDSSRLGYVSTCLKISSQCWYEAVYKNVLFVSGIDQNGPFELHQKLMHAAFMSNDVLDFLTKTKQFCLDAYYSTLPPGSKSDFDAEDDEISIQFQFVVQKFLLFESSSIYDWFNELKDSSTAKCYEKYFDFARLSYNSLPQELKTTLVDYHVRQVLMKYESSSEEIYDGPCVTSSNRIEEMEEVSMHYSLLLLLLNILQRAFINNKHVV